MGLAAQRADHGIEAAAHFFIESNTAVSFQTAQGEKHFRVMDQRAGHFFTKLPEIIRAGGENSGTAQLRDTYGKAIANGLGVNLECLAVAHRPGLFLGVFSWRCCQTQAALAAATTPAASAAT